MRISTRVIAMSLLLTTGMIFGQEVSVGRSASFKELLRERNIELTEPALIAALQNPDSHVRYLAALVLAEDKSTDAVPAIMEALAIEKVPETRVNIALALAQLGGKKGFAKLQGTCDDAEAAPYLRMYAAKYMLDLGEENCLAAVTEVSQSTADLGSRVLALSLLPRFQHASADDSRKILSAGLKALLDSQAEVRIAAGDAVVRLGNLSAIPSLERAIMREQDEAVRSQLNLDLERLKEKEQHSDPPS